MTTRVTGSPDQRHERRYAWCGRALTPVAREATIALRRQLHAAETFAACHGGRLVAWYWDAPAAHDHAAVTDHPIPRSGGLPDLLRHADEEPCPFDGVVVQHVRHLAARSADLLRTADALLNVGVPVYAIDEPPGGAALRHPVLAHMRLDVCRARTAVEA